MTNEKEGDYCTICGGIRPDAIKIKTVLVDGRETGINQLEFIVAGVRDLHLENDAAIRDELLRWASEFNYIPTKKKAAYGDALMQEYTATPE
ncbi:MULTISPECIES: NAC family transcription factor [unclassified Methanoculleus]|uniref:NAC family transcription factor n=1 Tax=unclassified Methanoculleus TaxID=2619537 RepID=UPI0025DDFC45|nr:MULTISPECIES: NAC family transcription factor [unclassified Methanoculleus]MCK9319465.1 NAC family transcription factor [Methanoculleus sp.]MDD2254573.1 NAC family transcription factor [Methanoculleus sp.]MDD2788523.1 NAC family transcription factor [Methanoculleus sp.]MDD3216928.1 NAC family transcription factor [Methanoculleus sp.]MDD4314940.1 NAC family transcription factor [Methanoculleus sp.]